MVAGVGREDPPWTANVTARRGLAWRLVIGLRVLLYLKAALVVGKGGRAVGAGWRCLPRRSGG